MTKRVAFIGAAGCGKSTLAAEAYVRLKKLGLNVEHVSEWVRTDIWLNAPMKSIWEQYRTWQNQRMVEDAVPEQVEWIITDSGCLTPYFYACLYTSGANERERLVLADMFKLFIDDLYRKRYEYVFFLPGALAREDATDKILNDGTRFQTTEELHILEEYMSLVFTKMFKVNNVYIIDCPLEERIDKIMKILLP